MSRIKIKFPKEIEILSSVYSVTYDKSHGGGSFDCAKSTITIGIKSIKNDPKYVFSVISHELMEIILAMMGGRFENMRTGDNYLFNFDHQTFENAIQIHAQALSKFI